MERKYSAFFLLLLCFQLCNTLSGQAWHPFPSGCTFGYTAQIPGEPNLYLFGARMDSVRLEGADSAHYLYRVDRPAFPNEVFVGCTGLQWTPSTAFRTNQDHFWGQKMLVSPDGTCRLVYSDLDTFVLRTQAVVGESWAFHSSLTATVDSVGMGSVLGVMDSLKYISLNDGRRIILSREHGLVQMFNPHRFNLKGGTNLSLDFQLWGIHEMGLGKRLPGIAEIYGFTPGDQQSTIFGSHGSSFYGYYRQYLYTIGSRVSQDPLAFNATIESDFTEFGSLVMNYYHYTYNPAYNTVLQYDSSNSSHIDLLPYQHNPKLGHVTNPYVLTSVQIPVNDPDRIEKNYLYLYTNMQGFYDSCAQAIGFYDPTTKFVVGKGEVHGHYDVSVAYDYFDLTCYKQLNDGNPSCTLTGPLAVPAPVDPQAEAVTTFPNPARDRIQFLFPENMHTSVDRVLVYTATGGLRMQEAVPRGNTVELDVRDLANGLYWASFEHAGQRIFRTKFVVQH